MTDDLAALYADHNRRLRRSRASYNSDPHAASRMSAQNAITNAVQRRRLTDTEAAEMRAEIHRW